MKLTLHSSARHAIAGAACLIVMASAQAQGSASSTQRWSLLPYTTQGYVGLNLGRPNWKLDCDDALGVYRCDDPDTRMDLYTGGLFNGWLGGEIGYTNEGKFDRAGGRARAEGIKLNLVLRAPMGPFNAFAKGGTIYGRTRVSADALSGVATGKEDGWGVSWGAGVGYDFTPNLGAVLEWSRNEYRFKGAGKDDVDSTNIGLVYRF